MPYKSLQHVHKIEDDGLNVWIHNLLIQTTHNGMVVVTIIISVVATFAVTAILGLIVLYALQSFLRSAMPILAV